MILERLGLQPQGLCVISSRGATGTKLRSVKLFDCAGLRFIPEDARILSDLKGIRCYSALSTGVSLIFSGPCSFCMRTGTGNGAAKEMNPRLIINLAGHGTFHNNRGLSVGFRNSRR